MPAVTGVSWNVTVTADNIELVMVALRYTCPPDPNPITVVPAGIVPATTVTTCPTRMLVVFAKNKIAVPLPEVALVAFVNVAKLTDTLVLVAAV